MRLRCLALIFTYLTQKKLHEKHEMYMANVNQTLACPTGPIFQWPALELALGPPGFGLGLLGFALGLQDFLDTNMLVSAKRWGRTQHEDPTQVGSRCSGI